MRYLISFPVLVSTSILLAQSRSPSWWSMRTPVQDTSDRYSVVQTLTTPVGSRTLGLDVTRHRLFVAAAKFGAAPAGGQRHGPVLPGSFQLLEIAR
jgi:hypothetical protein